jgi:hypothetical protein
MSRHKGPGCGGCLKANYARIRRVYKERSVRFPVGLDA